MDDNKREYLKQYRRDNLRRVPLDVKADMYDLIRIAADIEEVSVGRYIKRLIEADLELKQNEIARRKRWSIVDTDGDRMPVIMENKQETERVIFEKEDEHGWHVAILPKGAAEKIRKSKKDLP